MTQPETFSNSPAGSEIRVPHRNKVLLAWIACLFGVFGAHWWYLGRRHAWAITAFSVAMLVLARLYPVWWNSPFVLVLIIPAMDGFIEALVFALKPDEKFDAIYNPDSPRTTRTGWDAVFAAIAATLIGGFVLVYTIAVTTIHFYTAMGWLDGYVF